MVLDAEFSPTVGRRERYARVDFLTMWNNVDYYDAQYRLSIWIYKLRRAGSNTVGGIYIRVPTTPTYASAYYYDGRFNLSIRARELKCTGEQYYCYGGWNYTSIATRIKVPTYVECAFPSRCESRDGAIELYLEAMAVPTQLSSLV